LAGSQGGSTGGCSAAPLARQPLARGIHLLLLLCRGWAGTTGALLPLNVAGVLRALVAAPIAALPRSGGDLHPLLRDVRLRAAIGNLVPDVPRVALVQEGIQPDRHLIRP
jgi:hypothetical protein